MVDKTTEKQLGGATGKGFIPGESGNPKGRPKGSVSIITEIKKILQEIPNAEDKKTYAQKLARIIVEQAVEKADKEMIKLICNYIDGMPKQTFGLDADDILTGVNIQVISTKKDDSKPEINSSIPEELEGISTQGT